MSICLWTSWYPMTDERKEECKEAIVFNLSNPLVDKVTLLCECPFELEHPKLNCIQSERPTYKTFFDLFDDNYNIVLNTDIALDYNTTHLIKTIKPNSCYALTRYEKYTKDWVKPLISQDTWICYKLKLNTEPLDFYMGINGCDNRIAYELYKQGVHITNPSKSIKTYHHHKSLSRSYTNSYHDKGYSGLGITQTKLGFSVLNKTSYFVTHDIPSMANPNILWKHLKTFF